MRWFYPLFFVCEWDGPLSIFGIARTCYDGLAMLLDDNFVFVELRYAIGIA